MQQHGFLWWWKSTPSAAYMSQWSGSTLVQVMVCCLFSAKPLPEPMLSYCQLHPWERTSVKFESKYKTFHSRKCTRKRCLRNGKHFVQGEDELTHWGRATHICASKLPIIGSDNGLSPGRRQAIIWTNAGILLIWSLGTNVSEILSEIHTFSFTKMHLKVSGK